MSHFFFIDDSGPKTWENPYSAEFIKNAPPRTEENKNFWRRNYFILAGLHVPKNLIAKINEEINHAKTNCFGTNRVEIKSEWLRHPIQMRKKYLDQFQISAERLKKFVDNDWYRIFRDYSDALKIQAFVLDKRFFKHRRSESSPLQRLTHILFERLELNSRVDAYQIVFDQMQREIASERHDHGEILRVSRKEVGFSSFHKKYSHAKPEFRKSHQENFLQLADTAAYNVWRQFVDFGDDWINDFQNRQYDYYSQIVPNFYSKNGKFIGIGLVKYPREP